MTATTSETPISEIGNRVESVLPTRWGEGGVKGEVKIMQDVAHRIGKRPPRVARFQKEEALF